MKKASALSVVAVMIAAMSLSACGGTGSKPAESSSNPQNPAKHDPVKLSVVNATDNQTVEEFMQNYGDAIVKKFPYISFDYSSGSTSDFMKNRVASGTDIDIVYTTVGLTPTYFLDYNLQYDISPLIAKNKYDLSKLEPTSVQMQRNFANGGIYGLPVTTSTQNLFYNKDIFDKFGVQYPKDGMTWDQVYELAKQVSRSDGGVQYRGFDYDGIHYVRLNQLSLSYLDPKTNEPTFMSDGWKEIMDNFSRFNQIPGNFSKDWQNLNTTLSSFIKDKNLAMMYHGYDKDLSNVNWDVVSGPFFKDKPGVSAQSYPLFFYVSATSKHKDDDFDVISYLTSEEFQLMRAKQGNLPILKDDQKIIAAFGQDNDALKGKNVKALMPEKFADPSPYDKYNPQAETPLLQAMKANALGQKDDNTAMRDAVDAANKAVKTQMSK